MKLPQRLKIVGFFLLLFLLGCTGGLVGQSIFTSPQAASCVDTDGGLKYELLGKAFFKDAVGQKIFPEYTDTCGTGLKEDQLQEYFCSGKKQIKDAWGTCSLEQFCSERVCKKVTSCADTDGGINTPVKGTVTRKVGTFTLTRTDRCDAGKVVEYACTSSVPFRQSCPAGLTCNDGMCVCPAGLTRCGSTCVNLQANIDHCGSCTTRCKMGESCEEGMCLPPEPRALF